MANSTCAISTFGVESPWLWMCVVILFNHSFCSSTFSGCNCSAKNVRTSLENSDRKKLYQHFQKERKQKNVKMFLRSRLESIQFEYCCNFLTQNWNWFHLCVLCSFVCRICWSCLVDCELNFSVNQLCFGGHLELNFKKFVSPEVGCKLSTFSIEQLKF